MVRFLLNASQKNIEKLLDFSDNRGSQLWLDLLQIQSKKTLKPWLDF